MLHMVSGAGDGSVGDFGRIGVGVDGPHARDPYDMLAGLVGERTDGGKLAAVAHGGLDRLPSDSLDDRGCGAGFPARSAAVQCRGVMADVVSHEGRNEVVAVIVAVVATQLQRLSLVL